MDIHVTSRKIRVPSNLKEHARSHVSKFEHFFDHIQRCDVIFSKDGKIIDTKVVEIILHTNGHFLTAKESSDDFYKSFDIASEKIEHQLTTYKSKLIARKKTKTEKSAKMKIVA